MNRSTLNLDESAEMRLQVSILQRCIHGLDVRAAGLGVRME